MDGVRDPEIGQQRSVTVPCRPRVRWWFFRSILRCAPKDGHDREKATGMSSISRLPPISFRRSRRLGECQSQNKLCFYDSRLKRRDMGFYLEIQWTHCKRNREKILYTIYLNTFDCLCLVFDLQLQAEFAPAGYRLVRSVESGVLQPPNSLAPVILLIYITQSDEL